MVHPKPRDGPLPLVAFASTASAAGNDGESLTCQLLERSGVASLPVRVLVRPVVIGCGWLWFVLW